MKPKHRTFKALSLVTALTLTAVLAGCAAVHTSIAKRELDVQTKMSDTIFLDPVGADKRTIFLDVRNTSDKTNFDIVLPIKQALQSKGYIVSTDPDTAHYWLRANVLSVDKASPTAAESALHSGYGGSLAGIAAGAAIGGGLGGWSGAGIGGLAGAVVGGAVETIADAAVKDVTYMVVTDIEIAERAKQGVIVRQDNQQDAKQGIGGSLRQTSSEVTDRKRYRSRIVSTANQVNLEYNDAVPALTGGLVRSISGMF
ncbi:MAG: complement resistance protein TraT [Methylomonas sp.]|nr:complement resistance protein TraT [Methylomonas sp.]PPD21682.1 MAG: conjugal transfer protein TraT [Methylomonas sp.]PPD24803.1 MAG: conjugal transfer protein TraT [Methylomonas sp.]PPD33502.1 MAG: conjugal transfer protein TraT [Methylomonas sp.]PPD40687.1 MAG: conjugal transfer protein TraT [Methylomonas sp.]